MTGRPMRQRPEGFDERAPHTPTRQLVREFRCDHGTAIRWLAEIGIVREQTQAITMPEGFAEVAAIWTGARLQAEFDLSEHVVYRLRKRLGIKGRAVRGTAPAPEGFANAAHGTSIRALADRYGVSARQINRWRDAAGIARTHHSHPSRVGFKVQPPAAHSTEEMAANHLRRMCPVYRCRDDGRPDQRGSYWRYGRLVLTPAEIVARAQRKGFDPDAWQRIG